MNVCIAAALWAAFFMSKSMSAEVESPYPYVWCQIVLQVTARYMEEPSINGYFIPDINFVSEIKISFANINEVVRKADDLLLFVPELSIALTKDENRPLYEAWCRLKANLNSNYLTNKNFKLFLIECLWIKCPLFM